MTTSSSFADTQTWRSILQMKWYLCSIYPGGEKLTDWPCLDAKWSCPTGVITTAWVSYYNVITHFLLLASQPKLKLCSIKWNSLECKTSFIFLSLVFFCDLPQKYRTPLSHGVWFVKFKKLVFQMLQHPVIYTHSDFFFFFLKSQSYFCHAFDRGCQGVRIIRWATCPWISRQSRFHPHDSLIIIFKDACLVHFPPDPSK